MIITPNLVQDSQQRWKQARLDAAKPVADGPRRLTPEQKQQRYQQLLTQTGSPERARQTLERIIAGNDLDSVNYLSKGLNAARSVCRIQLRSTSGTVVGFGSGFLIGPGVLMTNHHVFSRASEARPSLADFDYELDAAGGQRTPVHFGFDPDRLFHANAELDVAVVAVQPQSEDGGRALKDWSWLPLSGEPGKSDAGEYLTIVQHPAGERKQVCVRENKLIKYDGQVMWYATDTLGGSSGSPVFNRFWQVVALHHSGVPETDGQGNWLTRDGRIWDPSMDESLIHWKANEGIRISAIVAHLASVLGDHPLLRGALTLAPPAPERVTERARRDVWLEQHGDAVSLVVPVRVPLDLVREDVAAALPRPQAAVVPAVSPASLLPIEAVNINQKTLGSRPGYKPTFLGTGSTRRVPLPVIPNSLTSSVATLTKKPTAFELKYFNYSVVMNRKRRLAFFSAVNIDGKRRLDVGKREGDKWLTDPRIAKDAQTGDEFYKKQKTFEDRSQNPFDRGHLVRRLDATWGTTVKKAKEHGDDTFHYTNAAPQFFSFNQGRKLWLGIEEFVLDQLEEDKRKACVINGPVFDGPKALPGGMPDPDGPRSEDPTFGGLAIPKYFWKIMVVRRSGKLAATAFLLSQQDQILDIDRIHEAAILEKLTAAQASVFQVRVSDLAKLTKLGFGPLVAADTKEAALPGPRRLESLEDIRL